MRRKRFEAKLLAMEFGQLLGGQGTGEHGLDPGTYPLKPNPSGEWGPRVDGGELMQMMGMEL